MHKITKPSKANNIETQEEYCSRETNKFRREEEERDVVSETHNF